MNVMDSLANRASDTKRRSHAFTLLELLCVLIILGIIAGVAVPRYANAIAQNRAAAMTRRITMDMALAQHRAKFIGTSHKVKFPAGLNKYLIPAMEDPDHPGQLYEVHLDEEPYGATLVLADFDCDDEIIYNPFGVPDSGGMVVIEVGDYRKKLTVAAQTGRVTVQDVNPGEQIVPPCMPTE